MLGDIIIVIVIVVVIELLAKSGESFYHLTALGPTAMEPITS